jgi:hypothetical protein
MAITFEIEIQDEYLKVKASGTDDTYQEVLDYFNAVAEVAIKHDIKKIFCDERKVVRSLPVLDILRLGENASQHSFRMARIAIVCDARFLQDGKFYETVASNRGLSMLVTADYDEAVRWLG